METYVVTAAFSGLISLIVVGIIGTVKTFFVVTELNATMKGHMLSETQKHEVIDSRLGTIETRLMGNGVN